MKILTSGQASVFTGTNQNVVFVFFIYFLQLPYRFQDYKIHPMLIGAENTLGFNCYFHGTSIIRHEEYEQTSYGNGICEND